jgi:hypothetical protein
LLAQQPFISSADRANCQSSAAAGTALLLYWPKDLMLCRTAAVHTTLHGSQGAMSEGENFYQGKWEFKQIPLVRYVSQQNTLHTRHRQVPRRCSTILESTLTKKQLLLRTVR